MVDWLKGLGYYIPPELRNWGTSAKAAANILRPNPIINNPNVANLLRSPSVAGLGKVLSDVAITGTEVLPGGKLVTTPIKKASKLADDAIVNFANKYKSGKPVTPEDITNTAKEIGTQKYTNKFHKKEHREQLAQEIFGDKTRWKEISDSHGLPVGVKPKHNEYKSMVQQLMENDPLGADFFGTYDKLFLKGTRTKTFGSNKNNFWNARFQNMKDHGVLNKEELSYMEDVIKNMDESEAFTRGLDEAQIFNPKGTIANIKASQISLTKHRKGTDKIIRTLVNRELGDLGKGLEKSIKKQGRNLFQWDHVKSFMFGGANTLDNITPIHVKPHQLQPIPGKFLNAEKAVKMKTAFETDIWSRYKKIIDFVNKGDSKSIAKAEKISNDVKQMINTAIENKVPYKFAIDEPHGAFKIADKQSELKNLIDVYSNNPDKVRSLIHKVEYTPDFLKTNVNDPIVRINKELEAVYNRISGLTVLGLPEKIIKEGVPGLNQGGLVGIDQLTRTLRNFSS